MRSDTDKAYLKHWREKRWYDGHREPTLQRDKFTCTKCGKSAQVVHHKDGKGRGYSGKIDNSLENLMTLCLSCHRKAHAKRGKYMVKVALLWGKSDREIGRLLKISHVLVGSIRKELADKILTENSPFYCDSRTTPCLQGKVKEERK